MISRRAFLAAISAFGLIPAIPSGARAASAHEAWRSAIGDGAAIRTVGLQCLRCGAVESEATLLVRGLEEGLAQRRLAIGGSDPGCVRAALAALRRADFAAGEVVKVDGWVLARSEARTYALAALLASRA